jgi:hypothetical protein
MWEKDKKLSRSAIDVVIDVSDDGIATRLANLLDEHGTWDWADDSDHDPSDRLAVLESSGAWWLVYRGTEADDATVYETWAEAWHALQESVTSTQEG